MNGNDTDEIIKLLFESFLQKYEENLQEKTRGSDFEFDGVNVCIMILIKQVYREVDHT